MDARRFDTLTRALTSVTNRRQLIRMAPALAASAAVIPEVTRADSTTGDAVGGSSTGTSTSTGGTTGGTGANVVCLPVAQTGADTSALRPPFLTEIYAGGCDSLGAEAVYSLFDVDSAKGVVGVPPAVPMATSVTTVKASLQDLLDERHSIVIRASDDDPTIVACGEIGGLQDEDELAVGIRTRSGSGYSGVSYMKGTNGSTLVYVFLGLGMSTSETASTEVGSVVVTTADVNLRAAPQSDAEVIDVIGAGTELQVTGAAVGEWVPVSDPSTGSAGYVSAQFLTLTE